MDKQIKIALAGNPNCGKTTLFNALTGSNQFVGNWPGVTVEKKEGKLKKHEDVVIMDLPGIYSLSPYTLEEVVARNYLIKERPDAILNIIDGTNLERNLYLTTQLTELGIPVVVAINMMDVVKKNGDSINTQELARELGCKVVEISALKGDGVMLAAEEAVRAANGGKTVPIYRDRSLNVFSDVDFIWTGEENENQRRLEYLGGEFRTRYGIDVSSFQGEIDWDAVADDNIDFAMVRVGFRGTGTGSLNTDKYYEQNIRGAMRVGLETGVYFFAQAVTVEEAIEEADYVISLLDGLDINGPVAYDWEMHDSTYRVYGTSPEMATACAVAFCERIKAAGYTPMVYGGTYVTYMKYDQGALADYLSWYPEYKSEKSEKLCPTLVYHMDYWQFSSTRAVAGINGRVDMNIQFIRR